MLSTDKKPCFHVHHGPALICGPNSTDNLLTQHTTAVCSPWVWAHTAYSMDDTVACCVKLVSLTRNTFLTAPNDCIVSGPRPNVMDHITDETDPT
jgi:hypothetical protein